MEGEWSCYRSGHFNEGRTVTLQKSSVNGGRIVMFQRWPIYCRENGMLH